MKYASDGVKFSIGDLNIDANGRSYVPMAIEVPNSDLTFEVPIFTDKLNVVLERMAAAPESRAAIIVDDTIFAWSYAARSTIGLQALPWYTASVPGRQSGFVFGNTIAGTMYKWHFERLESATNWVVLAGEDARLSDEEIRSPVTKIAMVFLIIFLAGLWACHWIVKEILSPLEDLARVGAGGGRCHENASDSITSSFNEIKLVRAALISAEQIRRGVVEEERNSRLKIEAIFNAMPNPIAVTDPEGKFLFVNAAYMKLKNMRKDELIGFRVDILGSERASMILHENFAMATDPYVVNEDMGRLEVGGRDRYFVRHKTSLRLNDATSLSGDHGGYVASFFDITELRETENRMRSMQAEYAKIVRANELVAMASGLAHELNQPLAATTTFLFAASRYVKRLPCYDAETQAFAHHRKAIECFEGASSQLLRAGAIVRRIRSYIGGGDPVREDLDICEVISRAVSLISAQEFGKSVRVSCVLHKQPIIISMDPLQISQVMINLLQNGVDSASHAGNDGHVWVEASLVNPEFALVSVSDNGTGFGPDGIGEWIFSPFQSRKNGGMGVGLSIARSFVEAHGGKIIPENIPSGGAKVSVFLPLYASDIESSSSEVEYRGPAS
jgi:two-component system sensor kinase FixL